MTDPSTTALPDRISAPETCPDAAFVLSSDAHGGGLIGLYRNGQWSGGRPAARATRMTFEQANVYARRLMEGGAYMATIYRAPNLAEPVRTFARGGPYGTVIARGADPDCNLDMHGYCSTHRQMRMCWSFAHGSDTPLPRRGGR